MSGFCGIWFCFVLSETHFFVSNLLIVEKRTQTGESESSDHKFSLLSTQSYFDVCVRKLLFENFYSKTYGRIIILNITIRCKS